MKREEYIEYGAPIRKRRDVLPHWEVDGGVYFFTFRLADALPPPTRKALRKEYEARIAAFKKLHKPGCSELAQFKHELAFEIFDGALNEGLGSCILAEDAVASVVAEALEYHHGVKYELAAWVIMPNHVHVVVHVYLRDDLKSIKTSWKGYTSTQIKKHLGTYGDGKSLWQESMYDRLIRTVEELHARIEYTLDNPRRAGLQDWKWARRYDAEWIPGLLT